MLGSLGRVFKLMLSIYERLPTFGWLRAPPLTLFWKPFKVKLRFGGENIYLVDNELSLADLVLVMGLISKFTAYNLYGFITCFITYNMF